MGSFERGGGGGGGLFTAPFVVALASWSPFVPFAALMVSDGAKYPFGYQVTAPLHRPSRRRPLRLLAVLVPFSVVADRTTPGIPVGGSSRRWWFESSPLVALVVSRALGGGSSGF